MKALMTVKTIRLTIVQTEKETENLELKGGENRVRERHVKHCLITKKQTPLMVIYSSTPLRTE